MEAGAQGGGEAGEVRLQPVEQGRRQGGGDHHEPRHQRRRGPQRPHLLREGRRVACGGREAPLPITPGIGTPPWEERPVLPAVISSNCW